MKKIFFIVAVSAIALMQQGFAQDSAKSNPSTLLTYYYQLKDALVSSNSNAAAVSSQEFIKALNGLDTLTIKAPKKNVLLNDAVVISKTKDLKIQRDKFTTLSANMYVLVKKTKLSMDPVYQLYCPMKKAIWLSNNPTVKNPYFGNAMLACGSVKETIE